MTSLPGPTPIRDRLEGHVTIITGAASHVGLETVRRFLLEGSKVVMVDIDDANLQSARESLVSIIPKSAERILTVIADVTAEHDAESFIEQTVKHFGRLDSAFLCAGYSYSSTSVLETPVDLYAKVMEINCQSGELTSQANGCHACPSPWLLFCQIVSWEMLDTTTFQHAHLSSLSSLLILGHTTNFYDPFADFDYVAFLGVKHCGRAMRKLGHPGSIVLASSASGLRATIGLTAYSMAKFALRGLSHTAAAELGRYGIRINTVHPSGVETPMFTQTWPEET